MTIRTLLAGAPIAAASTLALLAGAPPAAAMLSVTKHPSPTFGRGYPTYGHEVVAQPGGGVMRTLAESALQHIDRDGTSSLLSYPTDLRVVAESAELTDGSVAFVADRYRDDDYTVVGQAVLSVRPGSSTVWTITLPGRGLVDTSAVAPDGSIWRSRACAGLVTRTTPSGREQRHRLPRLRCTKASDQESSTRFAFGLDGSVWYANLCRARIVRFPLVGPRRTWRLPRRPMCSSYEEELREAPAALLPLPDGSLRFDGGRIDGHGRLRFDGTTVPDEVGQDGTEWRVGPQTVTRLTRGGGLERFASVRDGRRYIASALGPDGRLWLLRARLVDGWSAGNWNADPAIGVLGPHGFEGEPFDMARFGEVHPSLVTVADGLWVSAGWGTVKVSVAGVARPARARAVRVLARRDSATWVQIRCTGRPGMWCSGYVGLRSRRGARVSSSARIVLATGDVRAVHLKLSDRARSALRRGSLRAVAVVRVTGGRTARTPLVLR